MDRITIKNGIAGAAFLGMVTGSFCATTWPSVGASSTALSAPAQADFDFSLKACDKVQTEIPEISRLAQTVAQRHLQDGALNLLPNGQALASELLGRAGGMIAYNFYRNLKVERTAWGKSNDVAIIGWERGPAEKDLQMVKDAKAGGAYVIGLGPRQMPALAQHAALCAAWLDTGFGEDDREVLRAGGGKSGHANVLLNTLHGWLLTAEIVAAETRQGKTPAMYKSMFWPDGREWNARYVGKKQFDDQFHVAPLPPGVLAKAYLDTIRGLLKEVRRSQFATMQEMSRLIAAELVQGRQTMVASIGHMPRTYVGKTEDARWAQPCDLFGDDAKQAKTYMDSTPDGALVLRLGYSGQCQGDTEVFTKKRQREMLVVASDTPRADLKVPKGLCAKVEMGWAFGDACVTVPGYPIKILPPSGIIQWVIYECINADVLGSILPRK